MKAQKLAQKETDLNKSIYSQSLLSQTRFLPVTLKNKK